MNKLHHLSVIALFSVSAAICGAAAQSLDPGLDLEAIRARAREQTGDAEALAESARKRSEQLHSDARHLEAQASNNGRQYAANAKAAMPALPDMAFDFDSIVADAGRIAESGFDGAPRFIAFASTSMPPQSLRAMISDVGRAGGLVVLRGLPSGSAKALTAALAKVMRQGESYEGVGIDPRLFRAFGIEAVPAYVVAASDFELCDGFDCTSQVPPHDRMSGNVTAEHALSTFGSGGGPGARIAELHLARLRKDAP